MQPQAKMPDRLPTFHASSTAKAISKATILAIYPVEARHRSHRATGRAFAFGKFPIHASIR
jgi:hypothetical protein